MLRVLHIATDDKFFDDVFNLWEKDTRFENSAVLFTRSKDYEFSYIKNTKKVQLLWNPEMIKLCLNSRGYDILFFHSLPATYYNYFMNIPDDKIVIWWAWGYELYGSSKNSLIKINLYKPKTNKFIICHNLIRIFKVWVYNFLFIRKIKLLQERVLSRVDYFQPVLEVEYELMRNNMYFKAKEFYFNNSYSFFNSTTPKLPDGDILLGNSATPTMNHLDCLKYIKKGLLGTQKIIVPLNYGNEQYKKWLIPKLINYNSKIISSFIPKDEYFNIVDSCSYAVFGNIRKQGIGNIRYALGKGIKVFLFRDSIAYKYYKSQGFVVYAIEDINQLSFNKPLSKREIERNISASINEYNRRNNIYNRCVEEFIGFFKQ